MPHKAAVAGLVDELSDDARRLHAVNTIVCDGERLRGANTDAPGFERFLRLDAGSTLPGRDGADLRRRRGRSSVRARARARKARRRSRSPPGSRRAWRTSMPRSTACRPMSVRWDSIAAASVRADLIVNATPLGARGESLPMPPLGPDTLVVDLLYHPAVTPLQLEARERGRHGVRRHRAPPAPSRPLVRDVDGAAAAARGHVGRGARVDVRPRLTAPPCSSGRSPASSGPDAQAFATVRRCVG